MILRAENEVTPMSATQLGLGVWPCVVVVVGAVGSEQVSPNTGKLKNRSFYAHSSFNPVLTYWKENGPHVFSFTWFEQASSFSIMTALARVGLKKKKKRPGLSPSHSCHAYGLLCPPITCVSFVSSSLEKDKRSRHCLFTSNSCHPWCFSFYRMSLLFFWFLIFYSF